MLLLYRFGIFLYALMIHLASVFKPKARLFIEGRKNLLLKIKAQMGNESKPRIWIHCSSLGEFEQGRPLIESIRIRYPQYAIVLTFFSPSGYQIRKNYKGVDYVFYLPLDTQSNAKQFILNINPQLVIFVKYDLWYYYLHELFQKNIPVVLIDAIFRKQQGYFKWYGVVQRKMLHMLTHIFAQNIDSLNLVNSLGIKQCTIAGDTRFDRVLSVAQSIDPIEKIELLAQSYRLLIAGSTWREDEQLLASIVSTLPQNWKLIVVPHEVDEHRINEVHKIFSGNVQRWSTWQTPHLDSSVLVIDTIGLLLKLYRYGSLAWIGGGLGKRGVHNVLEAAVYGLPCAYGPVHHKYQEAVELIEQGGAITCSTPEQFKQFISSLIVDESLHKSYALEAQKYVASKVGATDIILNYLEEKNWLKIL